MARKLLIAALLVGVSGSTAAYAGTIGDFTGTSTPTVVTPQMTQPPRTPAYPGPRVGEDTGFIYTPAAHAHVHRGAAHQVQIR